MAGLHQMTIRKIIIKNCWAGLGADSTLELSRYFSSCTESGACMLFKTTFRGSDLYVVESSVEVAVMFDSQSVSISTT